MVKILCTIPILPPKRGPVKCLLESQPIVSGDLENDPVTLEAGVELLVIRARRYSDGLVVVVQTSLDRLEQREERPVVPVPRVHARIRSAVFGEVHVLPRRSEVVLVRLVAEVALAVHLLPRGLTRRSCSRGRG